MASSALARPSLVTLLDLSSVAGTPSLGKCETGLSSLRNALDAIGIPTQRPTISSVDNLRVSLMQMTAQSGSAHLVVVCGYGAMQDQNLFLAPPFGHGGSVDLTRDAVSAATLAHSVGQGGATLLDLTAVPNAPSPIVALSGWQAAAEPGTTRIGALNDGSSDTTTLVRRMTEAAQGRGDATMAELLGVPPGPNTVPVPVAAAGSSSPPSSKPVVKPTDAAAGKAQEKTDAPVAATPSHPSRSVQMPASGTAMSSSPATPPVPPVTAPVRPAKPVIKPKPAPRKAPVKASSALRDIQRGLLADGDYHGIISGFPNAATTAAIKKFQSKHDVPATGKLTPEQLKTLEGG